MLIEQLDRTQWTMVQAIEHVAERLRAHIQADPERIKTLAPPIIPWMRGNDLGEMSKNQAKCEILVALRDGDLHATGRLSDRRMSWGGEWALHSGHHSSITPEHWRSRMNVDLSVDSLSMVDGQFIDIRVPRFAVLAIWPQLSAEPLDSARLYRTPYLDLIDRAIGEFQISDGCQPKKDNLLDWFKTQSVDGESVSENLASAMATLVRLPASQRGGARRGI
ncbi:MAG: hypothetical protein HQL34_05325 [Alphaproteobacteria bacterium]|nr:hypothetical protein [Alphaproteobacteria bacterium]